MPGVVVHRVRDLTSRVQTLSPPRVRLEHALLDLAAQARSDLDAVGVLADAVGARRTTAARLLAAVRSRPRLAHRARIIAVLGDVELDRELDAVADEDLLTVRLGWGQVVDRGCQTIERLGRILAKRGWDGTPLACPACRVAA